MHKTLIFLHIPKAAGTTLSEVLVRQFEPSTIFHVRNPLDQHGPRYGEHGGTEQNFGALSDRSKTGLRLILGHLDCGIDRLLPQPARYITFLREPVGRVISAYRQHVHHQLAHGHCTAETAPTIDEFLSDPLVQENVQARYLAGWHNFTVPERQQALEMALGNLAQRMDFVGTQERFDESLVVLSKQYGWSDVSYVRRNVSAHRDVQVEHRPRPETQAFIESITELDRALYDEANRRLDTSIRDYGLSFTRHLRRFRRRNELQRRALLGETPTRWERLVNQSKELIGE